MYTPSSVTRGKYLSSLGIFFILCLNSLVKTSKKSPSILGFFSIKILSLSPVCSNLISLNLLDLRKSSYNRNFLLWSGICNPNLLSVVSVKLNLFSLFILISVFPRKPSICLCKDFIYL